MLKRSNLLAATAKASIAIGDSESLTFVYYVLIRKRFSEDEWAALLATNGREHLKTLLPRALVSWDLVDDEEHAVPVTAEAIDQHDIPDELLIAIERRIFGGDISGKVISSSSPGT